jgi:hypothetical protein
VICRDVPVTVSMDLSPCPVGRGLWGSRALISMRWNVGTYLTGTWAVMTCPTRITGRCRAHGLSNSSKHVRTSRHEQEKIQDVINKLFGDCCHFSSQSTYPPFPLSSRKHTIHRTPPPFLISPPAICLSSYTSQHGSQCERSLSCPGS